MYDWLHLHHEDLLVNMESFMPLFKMQHGIKTEKNAEQLEIVWVIQKFLMQNWQLQKK